MDLVSGEMGVGYQAKGGTGADPLPTKCPYEAANLEHVGSRKALILDDIR